MIDCMRMAGTAMRYMDFSIATSIRKPWKRICISCTFFCVMMIPSSMATICPATVATAAPFTPIAGIWNIPKMKIGSRMMFTMAPMPWIIMLYTVFPVDCMILSYVIWINTPKEKIVQICMYSIPIAIICASSENSCRNDLEKKMPIKANTIQLHNAQNSPCMATRLAFSCFFSPRYLDSNALMPTPVPQATATITICTG